MLVNDVPMNDLIAALGDENDEVRRNAQVALYELGLLALEPLAQALIEGDPVVRRRAAALLGNVGDARAVAPLVTALEVLQECDCDDHTLVQIVDALGHFSDPRGVRALMMTLPNVSAHVQRRIINALVSIGDRRAITPIKALVGDPDVGQTAQWALHQLGD